jgi:hypothetical protein
MAVTFKPSFGRLDGTVDASGATDHYALLEASELMPVGAEQVFEKAHSISAHDCKSLFAFTIGLWRTEGFDLAQHRAACFGEISSKPAAQVLPVDYSPNQAVGAFICEAPRPDPLSQCAIGEC